MTGKVKWFNAEKGYGFIVSSELEKEVFVHFSEIKQEGYKSLNEGDKVTFELKDTERGKQAVNVVKE